MVDLGVRIQLYQTVGADGVHAGYLGAVVCEEAFRAVAVPAVGDLFAAVSLRMPKSAQAPDVAFTPGVGPFLRVYAVEHYPVPVRAGAAPPWWDSFAEPGVTVVLHTGVAGVNVPKRKTSLLLTGSASNRSRRVERAGQGHDAPPRRVPSHVRDLVDDRPAGVERGLR